MATEIVHRGTGEITTAPLATREHLDLIKTVLAADAKLSDGELTLFAEVANRKGLDPFAGQIHATKRQGKLTIQTGIDGLRLIAERTGRWEGNDGPYWCGPDGEWRDVWLSDDPPAAAKVIVHKQGARPRTGIAHWREYAQYTADKEGGGRRLNRMWQTMPSGQLAKCAEALALRAQFPQEMSGLYADDEMGQADNPPPAEPAGTGRSSNGRARRSASSSKDRAEQPATPYDRLNGAVTVDEGLKLLTEAVGEPVSIDDFLAAVRTQWPDHADKITADAAQQLRGTALGEWLRVAYTQLAPAANLVGAHQ